MEFRERKILITGGTAGIGFALARVFLEHGANVAICGRDPARLDSALSQLPGAVGTVCDVGNTDALPGLVEDAVAQLGGLDMLVNNAGVQLAWELLGTPTGYEEAVFRVQRENTINFIAPLLLTHLALPHLLAGEAPMVVNLTSVLARQPKPNAPVYCASKAALRSLTASLRQQLAPHGLRVVEVVPPLVDTAMGNGRQTKAISARTMALATIAGLRAEQLEIRVGKARAAAVLDRIAPWLLARMVARG